MPSVMDTLINCRKMNPSTAIASSILALLIITALQLFFGVPEERVPAIKCTKNIDGYYTSTATDITSTATNIASTATEINSTATVEITSPAMDISSTATANWTATETWFPARHWTRQSKLSPAARARDPPNQTLYGTLEAQHAIWNHQHPSSCHDKRFLVYEFLDVGRGIGSGIHIAGVALQAALNLNRILVLYPQPNVSWNSGKFCEGMDTIDECYFEALSSCTIFDAFGSMDVSNDTLRKFEELTETVYRNNSGRVLRSTVWSGIPFLRVQTPVMFHGLLEKGGIPKNFYHWWRAQSAAYIVRPTLRTLRELDRRRGVIFQGRTLDPGTISVHVRHGDKWKESKLEDDATFLRSAEALVKRNSPGTSGLQRRIFLSTEDPDTVRFFANLSDWTVVYTNVTREAYKDKNVGPAKFAAMIGWDEEFLNSLLSLQLALECDGFVGGITSNWNRLIDELRSTVGCKHDRVYIDVVQGFDVTNFNW